MIIYNIISLFITFTLISLFLYLKITKKIGQLDLTETLPSQIFDYFLILFFFSLALLAYMIILYFIGIKNKKESLFDRYKNWLVFLQNYNIFLQAYSLVFDYIGPHHTKHLIQYSKKLVEYSKFKTLSIIFIFVVLPRAIIIITLLLDIFILKRLHYYFYSLLLLFMPLFFRLLVFIFTDLSSRLIPIFKEFLDIKEEEIPAGNFSNIIKDIETPMIITINLKPEYAYMDIDDLMYNFYYPLVFLRSHMDVYVLAWYKKINLFSILCYLTIQVLCWGYILLYSF